MRFHSHMSDAEYNSAKLAYIRSMLKPVESGCHEWQGYVAPLGYGFVSYRSRSRVVHRLLWVLMNGPVPKKMDVCHTCDNRKCANIDHRWLGTRQQNLKDASSKGRVHCQKKTHCPKGHAYAEHGVRHGKDQWRHCRICARAKQRIADGWSEADAYSVPPIPQDAPTPRRWRARLSQDGGI
jgi:hypothetical protein